MEKIRLAQILLAFLLIIGAYLPQGAGATDGEISGVEAFVRNVVSEAQTGSTDEADAARDLARFYALKDFRLIWTAPSRLDELIAAIEEIDADGLDPAGYGLDVLRGFRMTPARDRDEATSRDVIATHAYLQAVIDLSRGRLDQSEIEALWREGQISRAPDRDFLVARAAANTADVRDEFARARPDGRIYRALRSAYAQLRGEAAVGEWPFVPPGRTLREGDVDPLRVPLLRNRLAREGYPVVPHVDVDMFDPSLAAATLRFQHDHALAADGAVGPATLAVLNVPIAARIDQLRANLERFRWLSREIVGTLVLVDVAAAQVSYFRNGEEVWRARAQVGRPSRATPLLRSEVTHFTFNPTWTVPPTILRHDKLPQIRQDVGYLARHNLRVLDYAGTELDPEEIDWERPGPILLRQDPGPDNALGRVVIRFPNPFSVYLHDTPSQALFQRVERAFSSGCVRVERAMELVDLLLADDVASSVTHAVNDDRTRTLRLSRPVPVLLGYWTVAIGDDGSVGFRSDIYQHDAAIVAALDQSERERTATATALASAFHPQRRVGRGASANSQGNLSDSADSMNGAPPIRRSAPAFPPTTTNKDIDAF